jgi:hypothetical protein
MLSDNMIILGIIPFAATLMWALFFHLHPPSGERSLRSSLALACVLLGTFVICLTEALSALHLLKFIPVLTTWTVYLLIPLVVVTRGRNGIDWRGEITVILAKIKRLPLWMTLGIMGLFFLIFRMAIASPPCNYDVQCYHLPRQIYWLMQGGVQHFEATYSYQNSQPFLTEYLGLNLMMLSGGDAWHNLVQWLFFVAACGLVTLVTRSIGGRGRAQALAVLFIALVPVAFLEASNTKNDIVVSFFVLIPMLIGVRLWTGALVVTLPVLSLAALSAGLAMGTKGTALAFLPSSALLIVAACLCHRAWRVMLLAFLPCLLLPLLPLAPVAMRNLTTYHSLGGETAGLLNAEHHPKAILGVVIKDVVNQFAFGSKDSIHTLEYGVRSLMDRLGLNPDDPATSIQTPQLDSGKFSFFYMIGCEDVIPAPVQTALVLLLPLILLFPSFRKNSGTLPLACVMIGSFLLFCAIFRWQPWGGRLLIPAFFMAAPLIGKAEDLLRPRWMPILITALEVMFLWQHISYTGQRHLMGWCSVFHFSKESQMSVAFMGRKEEIRSVMDALRSKNVSQIQVDGKDSPIYGLLREIRISLPEAKIISGHLAAPNNADAIVEAVSGDEGVVPMGYHLDWSGKYYRVYSLIP